MGKLKTSVRLFGGVPAIHVNGVPVTGLMHWNRNMQAVFLQKAESGSFRSSAILTWTTELRQRTESGQGSRP